MKPPGPRCKTFQLLTSNRFLPLPPSAPDYLLRSLARFGSDMYAALFFSQLFYIALGNYWTGGVVPPPSPVREVGHREPAPYGGVVGDNLDLCLHRASLPRAYIGIRSFTVGSASPASSVEIESGIPDFTRRAAPIPMRFSFTASPGASHDALYILRAALPVTRMRLGGPPCFPPFAD